MNAKKCDRCGILYERYNEKNDGKKPNGFLFLNLDENGRYFSHKGYDLCPKCMDELIAWRKEGKKNAED